jgi:hypothetical protein
MKVEVNEGVNQNAGVPVIVKHKAHDLIVLKIAENGDVYCTFRGVVLHAGKKVTDRRAGEYCGHLDEGSFEPFCGNIILSND